METIQDFIKQFGFNNAKLLFLEPYHTVYEDSERFQQACRSINGGIRVVAITKNYISFRGLTQLIGEREKSE